MPKKRRLARQRGTFRSARPRKLQTGSTRPEELARADALRPSPLLMPQRRLAQSIMDRLDTADMTLAELAIAVLKTLGRPASPKEIHALVLVGRPDAAYDAVNRGLQRAIHRPDSGVRRKEGVYYTVDGKESTVEPEGTVASERSRVAVKSRLMEMFAKSPGVTLYVSDLAGALQCTEDQVRGAVSGIKQTHGDTFPVDVIIPARGWVHRPKGSNNTKASDILFKLIGGPTKDGSYILEREDGTLYQAREM